MENFSTLLKLYMIQQARPLPDAEDSPKGTPVVPVPHSINLKATLQSAFRFEDETFPEDFANIDPTTITYINYNAVLEMVQNTITMAKSEVITIEPCGLKDALLVNQLALNYVQFHLNLVDTRLEHLQDYLDTQVSWMRYIKWTRPHHAFQRFQQFKEQQQQSRNLCAHLSRAYLELRYTIRQNALGIVKSHVSDSEGHYITNVETLEESRNALLTLLHEIEDQLERSQKSRKVIYYAADRLRIYNKLQRVNLVLKNLSFQLGKVNLDISLITPELMKQLHFSEKKRLRWHFSDKYVFHILCKRQNALKICLDHLDRLLLPESHKLNLYANQVTNLGFLLRYAPADTMPSLSKFAPSAGKTLPKLVPEAKVKKGQPADKVVRNSQRSSPERLSSKPSKVQERLPQEELTAQKEPSDSVLALNLDEIEEQTPSPPSDLPKQSIPEKSVSPRNSPASPQPQDRLPQEQN